MIHGKKREKGEHRTTTMEHFHSHHREQTRTYSEARILSRWEAEATWIDYKYVHHLDHLTAWLTDHQDSEPRQINETRTAKFV